MDARALRKVLGTFFAHVLRVREPNEARIRAIYAIATAAQERAPGALAGTVHYMERERPDLRGPSGMGAAA